MKTIEERAKNIDTRKYETLALKADSSYEFGYMVGATEQKKIDIEKACDLFCKVHCQNGCILQKGFVCSKFMNFRKAFEQE